MLIRLILLAVGGLFIMAACVHASTNAVPAQQTATLQTDTLLGPPDLVTSVPFELDDTSNMQILLPATVSGRRGIFELDTGDPEELLIRHYVKPNATGGIDTVLAGESIPQSDVFDYPVTVRIGTLQTPHPVVTDISDDSGYALVNHRVRTVLGRVGLNALESFETIVDFRQKRIVLIKLDSAGHRLTAVPAYTPVTAVPMIHVLDHEQWCIVAHIGDFVDTLIVDTGTPRQLALNDQTMRSVRSHIVHSRLDHIVVGSRTFDNMVVVGPVVGIPSLLGSPFLEQFGAVGFNQRTRQLVLYQ